MAKKLLDVKDEKILSILDMNARMPNSKIGKEVGLSRKSVEYRIKSMEDKGIIKGYFPKINYLKLGFKVYRTFIRLLNHDSTVEKEIAEYCTTKENFYWFHPYGGRYDLGLGTLSRSNVEFNSFMDEFLERFGKNILERHTSEAIEINFYSHSYLHKNKEVVSSTVDTSTVNIDETDRQILSILMKDCKMPVIEIAQKLGLSNTAISKRIDKLVENKIILCFRTQLDIMKLGYSYYKVFFTLAKPKSQKRSILQYLQDEEHIVYSTIPIGNHDLECEMVVESSKDFHNIIRKMMSQFDITRYDYTIAEALEKIKTNNFFD